MAIIQRRAHTSTNPKLAEQATLRIVLLLERSDTYNAAESDPDYFDLLLSGGETLYAMNDAQRFLELLDERVRFVYLENQ